MSKTLHELSQEVARIASALADLSASEQNTRGGGLELTGRAIARIIGARRLRSRYFGEGLFADPAWDILLELLRARIDQRRLSVTALCGAVGVPPTTALRWVHLLTRQGLCLRQSDPADGRRVWIDLAPATEQHLRSYFAEVESMRG